MKYNVCIQKGTELRFIDSFDNFEDAYAITQVLYFEMMKTVNASFRYKIIKNVFKRELFHRFRTLETIKSELENHQYTEAGTIGDIGIFIDTIEV